MNKSLIDVAKLLENRLYTKEQLFDIVFRLFPAYSSNSCEWIIGSLLKEGVLVNVGFGHYKRLTRPFRGFPTTPTNRQAFSLAGKGVEEEQRAFYSSKGVAEVLGIANFIPCVILEVPKSDVFSVYLNASQYYGDRAMMHTRFSQGFHSEVRPNSIVVKGLFSKAPTLPSGQLSLEKIIVDLLADPSFQSIFPNVDFRAIIGRVINRFDINLTTSYNYAKRRRVHGQLLSVFREYLPEEYKEILPKE